MIHARLPAGLPAAVVRRALGMQVGVPRHGLPYLSFCSAALVHTRTVGYRDPHSQLRAYPRHS